MLKLKKPKNKKELKSILDLFSFYRSYLPGFAHKASILQDLLKSHVRFKWDNEHENALQSIRKSLKNVPVLGYPDASPQASPFILTTDASMCACAGVLSQRSKDGLTESLIGSFGRTLRPNERKFPIGELEILAVILGLDKFRHLLIGKKVIIRSDSRMVQYLKNIKTSPYARHCRWALKLSPLIDCDSTSFEYVKGSQNQVADYQ